MSLELHPFGRTALLAELGAADLARAFARAVRDSPAPGQVDVVGAETSVLIVFDVSGRFDAAEQHLRTLEVTPDAGVSGREIEIPVVYDGDDLAEVGAALGLTVDEVIETHSGQRWLAAFNGFAPGFAYLTGESDVLELPRRATPRTAVPAGSVAIADRYSGIYPRSSPGGWHLLGRTDAPLWDSTRTPPALIAPGDTIRFVPVSPPHGGRAESRPHLAEAGLDSARPPEGGGLEVLSPALQSLIQDGGRPNQLHYAVPRSGAADRASWIEGNELLGNRPGAASIETLFGGLRVVARQTVVLALTGATPGGTITSDSGTRTATSWSPFVLRAGETLEANPPTLGVRSYLAVGGGFETEIELGSRSTDVLTGLGPPPLAAGDILPIGTTHDGAVDPTVPPRAVPGANVLEVPIDLTHRSELFTDDSLRSLTESTWTISADSNRVGIRLTGDQTLQLRAPTELPSAPLVPGAVQVPPNGLPVIFLRDHPATGGYPVVGVVPEPALDDLAQLGPGARIRFRR